MLRLENIINVAFKDRKVAYVEGLTQWDKGFLLKVTGIEDLDGIVEVHFSLNEAGGEAKRALATVENGTLTVEIANFILQSEDVIDYNAYAFIYPTEDNKAKTVRKIVFGIKARPKPADWVEPDEPDVIGQLIEQVHKKADKAITLSGYNITDAYTKKETKEMIDSLNLEMYRFICANDLPKKVDVTTFNETVGNIETEFDKVESIAKGRATGYVFDTVSDLDLWLKDENNVSQLVLGDNFYIRGLDVPDYWWDGKEKQQLETQKVDLSEYCTKKEAEEKVNITVFNEMMSTKADKEGNYELIEKIIVGYSITTSEPEDWETNYAAYYKNTGTLREPVYTALTELETWEEGKYFSYSSEDVTINMLSTEPDGTLFSFKGVILDITFSAATSNRNFAFSLRSNTASATSGKLLEVNESNAIKTTSQWYQACFEGFNGGAWKGFHNINYTIKPVISRQIPRGGIMRAIRLSASSIPAGSTIIIYGVRA